MKNHRAAIGRSVIKSVQLQMGAVPISRYNDNHNRKNNKKQNVQIAVVVDLRYCRRFFDLEQRAGDYRQQTTQHDRQAPGWTEIRQDACVVWQHSKPLFSLADRAIIY